MSTLLSCSLCRLRKLSFFVRPLPPLILSASAVFYHPLLCQPCQSKDSRKMLPSRIHLYSPIQKNELDTEHDPDSTLTLLQDESSKLKSTAWYRPSKADSLHLLARFSIVIAISLLSFLAGWTVHSPPTSVVSSWDSVHKAIQYEQRTFEPHFVGPPSEYQGDPSPELDARWHELASLRNFGVDREALVRANKTKANVEFPGTSTYQAGLEVFHQLHCLNFIRMYTNKDYYKKVDGDMMVESEQDTKEHKDHCIENLRQRLMCNPDLQIYTYHWVANGDLPFADLRTNHQCVDWKRFFAWSDRHTVRVPPLHRPEGAEMLTEEDKWGW